MATDPRKRQKKLQRRTAKRKEKKHGIVRTLSSGIAERLAAATRYPVLHSWITDDLWTQGLGWALLSRALPSGSVAVVVFLVDRYCLGVKNVILDVVGPYSYERDFQWKMHHKFTSREVAPATVRKLVEEAVAYARRLGFPPHPDYERACRIFGDINAADSTATFEFGKDGKPFFISGPNETPERSKRILASLRDTCGEGGFDFLMHVTGKEMVRSLPPEGPFLDGPDAEEDEFEEDDLEDDLEGGQRTS